MCNLYLTLKELCDKKGVSGAKMCEDINYSKNLMTELKNGRKKTITIEVASKLANYFGVSVDYILGNETKEKLINGDPELTNYLEELRTRPEMRMLFSVSKTCTKEEVEQAVKIIEALRNG